MPLLPFNAYRDRVSPMWRGVIKVTLAMVILSAMYAVADFLLWEMGRAGWIDPDAATPKYAAEYGLAAIALSYMPQRGDMRRSFSRRFAGTAAGVIVGAVIWQVPIPDYIGAVIAVGAGWAIGSYIGGMAVADKAAFFAGITALQPADHVTLSLASRLAGTALGFIAVYLVITYVWPTDEPEERPQRLVGG